MPTLIHTSARHVATFDSLRDRIAPGRALAHVVREDLLARAMDEGVTPIIVAELETLITGMPGPVLCTCSTLGEVAEAAGALRIDRPMMRAAANVGGPVLLACCLRETLAPSRALLAEEMVRAGNLAAIHPVVIGEAWPRFLDGDDAGFAAEIARAVRGDLDSGVRAIVLAQVSMAVARPTLRDAGIPVFAAPEAALRMVIASEDAAL